MTWLGRWERARDEVTKWRILAIRNFFVLCFLWVRSRSNSPFWRLEMKLGGKERADLGIAESSSAISFRFKLPRADTRQEPGGQASGVGVPLSGHTTIIIIFNGKTSIPQQCSESQEKSEEKRTYSKAGRPKSRPTCAATGTDIALCGSRAAATRQFLQINFR